MSSNAPALSAPTVNRFSMLLSALVVALCAAFFIPALAQADEIAAQEGDWGTCHWTLSAEGELHIGPGEGEKPESNAVFPWLAEEVCEKVKSVRFGDGEAETIAPNSSAGLLRGCTNLESVDLHGLNTEQMENFDSMFKGCSSLKHVDLSCLDVSKVESAADMFEGCTGLESVTLPNFEPKRLITSCM